MTTERQWLHDLASPLQVLSMGLELMAESQTAQATDLKSQQYFSRALAAAEMLKAMVHSRRSELGNEEEEAMKPTILVVDDDEALRETIAFDMKRRGYEVFIASGGHEAFKIIQEQHVSLVISDVRMPDGDGIELLQKVRSNDYQTPVLMFITGFADMTLEEAYDFGADAVLAKPFKRAELFEAVERALKPRELRWQDRPERIEVDMELSLKLPGLENSISGRVLNIGRGGMFVSFAGKLPQKGNSVHFHLDLQDGSGALSGQGLVRWTRAASIEPGTEPGFGMEFLFLEAGCRQRILNYIEELKMKAFIPAA